MVEPTESEDLAEFDRFCEAMIAIRAEIDQVAVGRWGVRTVHSAAHRIRRRRWWRRLGATLRPATAVFPAGHQPSKYWPPVARIDQAYGDRNLMCTCPRPEAFRFLKRAVRPTP